MIIQVKAHRNVTTNLPAQNTLTQILTSKLLKHKNKQNKKKSRNPGLPGRVQQPPKSVDFRQRRWWGDDVTGDDTPRDVIDGGRDTAAARNGSVAVNVAAAAAEGYQLQWSHDR